MGYLPNDYYQNLIKQSQPVNNVPVAPGVFSTSTPANTNAASTPAVAAGPTPSQFLDEATSNLNSGPLIDSGLTPEEQAKRFGGVIGSPEYVRYKSDQAISPIKLVTGAKSFGTPGIGLPGLGVLSFSGPLLRQMGSALGIQFPDEQTWDGLTMADKTAHIALASSIATTKLFTSLPREIIKAPISIVLSVYKPWANFVTGKDTNLPAVTEDKPVQIPWIGAVPTIWRTYQDAIDSGVGPLAATIMTGSKALGDVAITAGTGEALGTAFQPRTAIKESQPITNTGPVKSALVEDQGKMVGVAKKDSLNEYYRIPKTTAGEFGGNTNNTFLKFTPAGADSVEISVVQTRGTGVVAKGIDFIKTKFGNAQSTYAGDFGPEIKLQSQIIRTGSDFSVGAAPYRGVSVTDFGAMQKEFQTPEFKNFEGSIPTTAEKYGVQIMKNNDAAGAWKDTDLGKVVFEPSKRIEGKGNLEQADGFGADLGAQRNQQAVYRAFYKSDNPQGFEYSIPFKDTQSAFNFVKTIEESGIEGVSLDSSGKIVYIGDIDGSIAAKVTNFYERAKGQNLTAGEKSARPADIKFIGESEYSGLVNRKAGTTQEGGVQNTAIGTERSGFRNNVSSKQEIGAEEASKILSSIPPKALRGFENKLITSEQLGNLNLIGKVNGIDPAVQDAVVRTISGKNAVGELTQAEYVKTAQALASFNEIGKYAPDISGLNLFSRYGSPQRYWMRTYEEKTGLPLYSKAYVPMEEAIRLRDVFRDSYRNQAREIFGKYAEPAFAEERRFVKSYMEGDSASILSNNTLTTATKMELVKIAEQMRPLYDKLGTQFGISTEVFLKDYQPHIQDLGGVYQIYKDGQQIPKSLEFFAKFKRRGSVSPQIDDALALFDIYTNAGSNTTFLNPVLDRIGALGDKIPATVQNSLRSYVQEKLGYAGPLEEYLNNIGTSINKKLGTNLPPDVVRQVAQLYMDTTYSGGMGLNPGTVFRNGLQYDLMAYPRLGPTFYKEALQTSLTKEGMAEVRNAGFFVGSGEPYGQALTQDVTMFGKAGSLYRQGIQATLQPFSAVESLNRARTYWQVKYQFNDALSKYNSGKSTWKQFENKLDFNSLSPVDQNIIRQRLAAGDVKGAFENLARDIIDETQFPYRRGASSRITYGLTGRVGTQFSQWNIEFVHTIGRWINQAAHRNPDKLIRFAAASYAIQRSFQDALGFDFTKSIGLGPFSANFSPAVKSAIDIVNGFNAWKSGNAQTLNDSADSIAKTIKSLGMPAGAEIQKWKSFLYSYDKGPIGPNGTYGVYDQRGRLQYWTDFQDIFWQMWGFTTTQKATYNTQAQDLRNATFDYSQTKQKVLELYQQEKYDEANQLINEYGIKIGPNDFDQYYIPFTDRTFKALPGPLKAQFAPQLYPTK